MFMVWYRHSDIMQLWLHPISHLVLAYIFINWERGCVSILRASERALYEGVFKSFRTEVIMKHTLTTINTR
jgi:hypothetical protein